MAIAVAAKERRRRWSRSSPWWARRVAETNLSGEACAKVDCRSRGQTPFDLYCEGNPPRDPTVDRHLLLFAKRPFLQHLVVNALRVTFGVLAFAAAVYGTELPLYAAGALAGALLLAFPLRSFRVSRVAGLVGFLTAVTLTALVEQEVLTGATTHGVVFGVVVIGLGLLAAAALLFAGDALGVREEDESASASATFLGVRAIAGGLVAGAGLLVALAVYQEVLDEPLGGLDGRVSSALFGIALGSIGSALLLAAVIGLFRAATRFGEDPVGSLLREPAPFSGPRLPRPAPLTPPPLSRRDFFGRIMFALARFLVAAVRRLGDGVEGALRVLSRALHLLVVTLVRVINFVYGALVQILRSLWGAVREALRYLLLAARGGTGALVRCGRSLLVSAVLLGGAGTGAVYASGQFANYLADGGFVPALVAIALGSGVALLLVASWWSLTAWPQPGEVRDAGLRLLSDAGPTLFLVALALGWVYGVLGYAGVGSVRPGWLTYGGTLLLGLGFLATRSRWVKAETRGGEGDDEPEAFAARVRSSVRRRTVG